MKKQILNIAFLLVAICTVSASYAAGGSASTSAKGYTVHTVIDGHNSTVAYNKKGSWLYTIQNYNADNLDLNIVNKIKTAYDKYSINGIQKIQQPGQDEVCVAYLEDAGTIKTVRISNGEMELVQEYSK
ncbi:hypothetical protein BH11BAC6_BH11BAC6_12450 [soil metagenome]